MKKYIIATLLMASCLCSTPHTSQAQIPIVNLVTAVIKKVIIAIDLKVQALQNKTIALQNAERQLENSLHLSSLHHINGWLNKEKDLYSGYYQELNKVRGIIAQYDEVKSTINKQVQLTSEYRQASALFNRDRHFTPDELQYMGNIYNGILQESLRNLDELLLTMRSLSTQMDDADRLARISQSSKAVQTNLDHLRQFNRQNVGLSLMRSRDEQERQTVRQFYGIVH